MRRARSQLSKLTQQQAGGYGAYPMGNEAEEIQRRLNSMHKQSGMMQQHQHGVNDPMSNFGFPQPTQSMGFQQPMPSPQAPPQHMMQPQHGMPQQQYFEQPPVANPYQQQNPNYGNPAHLSPIVEQMPHVGDVFANNPQLENIKSALEQMSAKLHAVNGANAATKESHNIALQQSEILKQHYNHINNELQGLKTSIAGISSADNGEAGLQVIQETLSANYRAIMQQLESSQGAAIDNSVFSSAIEASHKDLSKQIIGMKESIDASLNNPNIYAKTLEVSHDDITKRLDDMHNALQTSIATPDLYINAIENNHRELSKQVMDLQEVVEKVDKSASYSEKSEGVSAEFSSIEVRLEEITRAVVALSLEDGNINNLERIEARISDMAKTIDGLGTPKSKTDSEDMKKLEAKLSDITSLMNSSSPDMSGMETQINKLSAKIDGFSVPQAKPDEKSFKKLEAKLSDITSLMNATSPDMSGMEKQIDKLSEKLENLSSLSVAAPISNQENNALLQRMDALVDQISKSQSEANDYVSNDAVTQQLSQISTAIDKLSMPAKDNSQTNDVIVNQLEQIAGAIDQLSMPSSHTMSDDNFNSIEKQLSIISGQITNPSTETTDFSLDPIVNRLTGIEEQLGSNRDITIELATKAAEDAVKMSVKAMPQMPLQAAQMDSSALDSMSEVLARLNQETQNNNTKSIEAFGAVTETLDLMVQRLGSIESELANKNVAAPVMPSAVGLPLMETQQVQSGFSSTQEVSNQPETESAPANYEPPVMPEDNKVKSPADDLVQAARLANADVTEEYSQTETIKTDELSAVEKLADSAEDLKEEISEKLELPEVETPEMSMENMPEVSSNDLPDQESDVALEPGAGTPDLAALVRQANNQRKNNKANDIESSGSDFIAAARRAAQAAAQEAGSVEEEIEEKTKKGLLASLPELFGRRKKAIVMGAAALLFVALAVPLASKFIGGQQTQVASIETPAVIADEAVDNLSQASVLPAADKVAQITDDNVVEPIENIGSNIAEVVDDTLSPQVNIETASLNITPEAENFELPNELNFGSDALKQAAQNGEPDALFEIGKRYTDGLGTPKDLAKAAEWYEKAAELGFAPAQYIVGNFNEKGLGIEKNPAIAAKWYEKAAKGGNIIAMHNLAVLTATPNALSAQPDMQEAFKWFSKAADYGVRDSQVNAGIFHTKGFGTEVNLVEAYKWFSIAAKAGDKDAANKRDVITNAIQPDQLEIAKSLVEEWKPLEVVTAANEVQTNTAWGTPKAVANAPFKVDRNTIAQTQSLLTKVGFNAGTPDGIMGQNTRNAISAFQRKVGLPVNGQIDGEFLKALKAIAV